MRLSCVALSALVLGGCSDPNPPHIHAVPDMTRPPAGQVAPERRPTATILKSYANAWRGKTEFELSSATILGVWIDGDGYTIEITNDGGTFSAGAPNHFDWGFETDRETLIKLDNRSFNALTAMGQARASDPIPLRIRLPDNFSAEGDIRHYFIPLTRHFWNREWPETIHFGEGTTRDIHGANATLLVYDDGLRTGWYQLKPGMHINSDLADQVNNFDSAIIVIKGHFSGKLNGIERVFQEGETVLVPEGMTHEFYASDEEYGEFLILMWGENA